MPERETSRQILEIVPRAMRLLRSEMRQYAKGQLTVPQFRILIRLNKLGKQSHKDVAEWIGITPATLTRIIDTLVKRKLVIRECGSIDRRLTFLSPTPAGKTLAEKYHDKMNDLLRKKINALSLAEKNALRDGLFILSSIFPESGIIKD